MNPIVLLTAWGAPVGTEYLKRLSEIKNINLAVVYENNPKLQKEIERIYQERFGEQSPQFEPIDSVIKGRNIPSFSVPNLNSEESLAVMKKIRPSFGILGGTGIVKSALLAIPEMGIINCHPGLLPRYRGCTCLEWAIYEDEPVGATCHLVSEEIDAGDILRKETMAVYRNDSYLDIRLRMFYFQATLMEQVVKDHKILNGKTWGQIEKFDQTKACYYKPIPEDKLQVVYEKIKQGHYAHALERV